jgi:hypothetical protein
MNAMFALLFVVLAQVTGITATVDTANVNFGGSVTVQPLVNDTGTNLIILGATPPGSGTIVISSDLKSITYTSTGTNVVVDVFTYTVGDGSGARATGDVQIGVGVSTDTIKPIITIEGPTTFTLLANTQFTDPGAYAIDATSTVPGTESYIPFNTVSNVNMNTPGVYTITYTAKDVSGNMADPKTRTVTVIANATSTALEQRVTAIENKWKSFPIVVGVRSTTNNQIRYVPGRVSPN